MGSHAQSSVWGRLGAMTVWGWRRSLVVSLAVKWAVRWAVGWMVAGVLYPIGALGGKTSRGEAKLEERLLAAEADWAQAALSYGQAGEQMAQRIQTWVQAPQTPFLALWAGDAGLQGWLARRQGLRWLARHDRQMLARWQSKKQALESLEAQIVAERTALQQMRLMAAKKSYRQTSASDSKSRGRHRRKARPKLAKPLLQFTIEKPFGPLYDPEFGTEVHHPGMVLQAQKNAPVLAPAPGEVIYRGEVEGYGDVVILSHGPRLQTLLAHMDLVACTVGQNVMRGEVVGRVAAELDGLQAGIYTEVRWDGMPEDPAAWYGLAKRSR